MLITEERINNMLTESEKVVYLYIKNKAQTHGNSIRESMSDIGEQINLSEATVHRAVKKLRKEGIVGIVPSMEKAESNEIIYFGIPDPEKQVQDIFQMINELSSSANRFEAILNAKNKEIEQTKLDNELLYKRIAELEFQLRNAFAKNSGFEENRIISSQDLGDGTTAYIIKN